MNHLWSAFIFFLASASTAASQTGSRSGSLEIERFNNAFAAATRTMNTEATLDLWDADGISLLPSTRPIIGKPAIAKFLAGVMASIPDARMRSFVSECFDIRVSGDWASEWCTEHQVVDLGAGKPPFDGYGKMLLVLHRGADAKWRLHTEMWNQGLSQNSPAHE